MGKSRKSSEGADKNNESQNGDEQSGDVSVNQVSYEDKCRYLSPISQPLAPKKMSKKLYKMVRKAHNNKNLKKGIKEVQKALRRGEKGIVILAGDVSPMDIISHMPVFCEEQQVPYCYCPSKADLGEAYGAKRQACMVLIKEHEAYSDDFSELKTKIAELPLPY